MNYYEHHIGDYDSATAHLSVLEDGIYSRLLRVYYRTERPIAADLKQVCRLVRASSKAERDAVRAVLEEFFVLADDGWHNERCDSEIARYADGEPEREIKKANESNRLKRHREERARLFKLLTDAGQHAPWNVSMSELRDLVKRHVQPLPETAPATPATATQTPDTRHQTPKEEIGRAAATTVGAHSRGEAPDTSGHQPTPAGLACRAMKAKGMAQVNPGDPRLLALIAQGATVEEFEGIAEEAVAKSKGFAWVLTVLASRREEAAQLRLAPTQQQLDAQDPEAWTRNWTQVEDRALNLGMNRWNPADALTGRGLTKPQYLAEVKRRLAAKEQTA